MVGLLIATALGLAALAGFFHKIEGKIKVGTGGLEFPIGAPRAEQQIEQGKAVDANRIAAAVDALTETLSQFSVSQGGPVEPTIPTGPPPPRGQYEVLMVDDAVATFATLTAEERHLVQMEIARMSSPGFHTKSDPRAILRGDAGRSYHVHRVSDSNLRLWYRPLAKRGEDAPDRLVVVSIEK